MGLNGEGELKIILKGNVQEVENNKYGVVSVVFVTMDKSTAKERIEKLLQQADKKDYYMVYSVPLNMDLTQLEHYPSIAIAREDLN